MKTSKPECITLILCNALLPFHPSGGKKKNRADDTMSLACMRLYFRLHGLGFTELFARNVRLQQLRKCSSKDTKMPCTEVTQAVSPAKRAKEENATERIILKFKKLSENAYTPTRGSSKAAGYDLYSAYDYVIPAGEKTVVKTDIQIALPSGCYGRVAPRSGLAAKHFIDVGAGVIDEDYRGNVGVVLFNFNKEPFEIKKGDRVAQLICERIFYPDLEELENLDDTKRGAGGFGSTGQN